MGKILEVLIDGEVQVRFDRERTLPGLERSRIADIDGMLDQGIGTGPARIEQPTVEDKTRFVVGQLIRALLADDTLATARLCAYLSQIQPQLASVEALKQGEDLDVRLVYDS